MRKIKAFMVLFMLFPLVFSDAMLINVHANPFEHPDLDVMKNRLLIESAVISDIGMEAAKNTLLRAFSENITEADVIRAINDAMTDSGSSEYVEAFGVIVASGEQSALPHGDTSDDETNLILPGEVVVVDLGARYRGYCTDLTRTFFMGNATQEMMHIYNITLEAELAAFEVVQSGVWARDVDKAARDVISSYGYGENFTHGLGHGIGLYIHMPPYLDPNSDHILFESGDMCITIEPGIYIEGKFGVRTEDDVFVERTGHEVLTFFPKDLESAILLPENPINSIPNSGELHEKEDQEASYLPALVGIFLIAAIGAVMIRRRKIKSF